MRFGLASEIALHFHPDRGTADVRPNREHNENCGTGPDIESTDALADRS